MGVSVSASTAIILAGLFFAFTAFYPVAENGFERVTAAQHDVNERALERQNTDVGIVTAEVSDTTDDGEVDELAVDVDNDGANGLVVSDTTLVVDNEYVDLAAVETTVTDDGSDPNAATDLWLAGETLEIRIGDGDLETTSVSEAERVVVVTELGVRDAADVEEVS